MSTAISFKQLFSDIPKELNLAVYDLGIKTINVASLSPEEINAIDTVWNIGIEYIRRISPTVASIIEPQKPLVYKLAQIVKAEIDKAIGFPSEANKITPSWLIPQLVKWAADAPTAYKNNSWLIDVTAGTSVYLLGSDTAFYKPPATEGSRIRFLIFQNGIIQVGSRPVFNQFKLITEVRSEYGAWTQPPLIDLNVEEGKPIYIYSFPFALFVLRTPGIKLSAMPVTTQANVDIRLLGFGFYEHEYLANFKYI